jgi:uncharacterized protein (TIGR01777 family)
MTEPIQTIAVTGATGFVGRTLTATLEGSGAPLRVVPIGRSAGSGGIRWDPLRGELAAEALEGIDAVVHFAGEPIGPGRWTKARKQRIRDSRVEGTRLLVNAFAKLRHPPKVLVQASAVGFYGDTGDTWVDEQSPAGQGFLAGVCEAWEAASTPAEAMGVRVLRLRFGHVLGPGGLLQALRTPGKLGLLGRLGSGRQYWSWIGLPDLVSIILTGLADPTLRGVVNAVTPNPERNADFIERYASALHRPALLPVPRFAIELVLGREQAHEMLLWGQRVRPGVLLERGFEYRWPGLEEALLAVVGGAIELPVAQAAALDIAA